MLSRIDEFIFPDRCEVIEFPSQQFVYPIFKNGSSSLNGHALVNRYKILFNTQISKIDIINVFIRSPNPRFISGITTFVYNLQKTHPRLDFDTILYFVENYLFLNRHYSPQLSWLINLNRYTNPHCKIRVHGMESLRLYTPLNITPNEDRTLPDEVIERLLTNEHNVMYNRLDTLLLNYQSLFTCIEFLQGMGFHANSFVIGQLLAPDYLNIRHLPANMLMQVGVVIQQWLDKKHGFLLDNGLENVLKYISIPINSNIDNCLLEIAKLDSRRGIDSKRVFTTFYKDVKGNNNGKTV